MSDDDGFPGWATAVIVVVLILIFLPLFLWYMGRQKASQQVDLDYYTRLITGSPWVDV